MIQRVDGILLFVGKPALIPVICFMYLSSAISSIYYVADEGYIFSGIFILALGSLALGLWRLKRWAMVVEIVFCAIQVIGCLLLALIVYVSQQSAIAMSVDHAALLVVLGTILIVGVVIVWYLMRPQVRRVFR